MVYSVIVSIFVYKDMDWKSLYETLVGAENTNGLVFEKQESKSENEGQE